jgi:hypothetical protein
MIQNWIIAIAAVLSAIATIVYVYVTARLLGQVRNQAEYAGEQLDIMQGTLTETRKSVEVAERSIEIAQETTITIQRAYITVSAIAGYYDRRDGKFLGEFNLTIKNVGNTPANNVRMFAESEIAQHPKIGNGKLLNVPDTDSPNWTRLGLIEQNATHSERVYIESSPDEEQRITNGELHFCCQGIIQYEDRFRITRSTNFCFVKQPLSTGVIPCKAGNEAT